MMPNTATRWGWPSKLLHWSAALAILILVLHGWWMTHMTPRPERALNPSQHAGAASHSAPAKSIGS